MDIIEHIYIDIPVRNLFGSCVWMLGVGCVKSNLFKSTKKSSSKQKLQKNIFVEQNTLFQFLYSQRNFI